MGEVTTTDRFVNGSTNVAVNFGAPAETDIRDLATSYLMYKIGLWFVQLYVFMKISKLKSKTKRQGQQVNFLLYF